MECPTCDDLDKQIMALQARQQDCENPVRKNLLEQQEHALAERLASHQAIECANAQS
jgi:hypothetical protein